MQHMIKTKFDEFKTLAKEVEMFKVEMMKYVDVKQIDLLKGRIDGVDTNIFGLRKTVTDLDKKMKQAKAQNRGDSCDQTIVDKIIQEVEALRNEFEEYREDASAKISYFEEEFPLKAYKSEVLE